MNVNNLSAAIEAWNVSGIDVEEELCLNLRGRGDICTKCEDACRHDALILSIDDIILSQSDCSNCGACLPACPSGVFRLSGFDPERLVAAMEGTKEVHLHCRSSCDGGGGVVIPCHHLLDARLVAAAMAGGTNVFHMHGLKKCDECSVGDARDQIGNVRRQLNRWFGDAVPEIVEASTVSETGAGRYDYQDQVHTNRRGFLCMAGLRAATGAVWMIPFSNDDDDDEISETPFRQGCDELKRPVAYQQTLGTRAKGLPWQGGRPMPWRTRTFSEKCSACMVCYERCPTGALVGHKGRELREISFDPALCMGCELCTRLCPEKAIKARVADNTDILADARHILIRKSVRACQQCGELFSPDCDDGSLCNSCLNEQDIDDEFMNILKG